MIKKIKITLVVIAILSGLILAILFLQDRTKKLEDRSYKEINKIIIDSDTADINFYKSGDEKVRVVVYGTSKDKVQIVEGTKYLTISKETKKKTCILNCKNEIDIYIPDDFEKIELKTSVGNIYAEKVTIKDITINSDIGNVSLDNVNVFNINTNVGNVTINTINAKNNSSIKTDVGNVTIDKLVNLKLDAKSEKGSVVIPYIKEEQEFTLKIESNVGNIDINQYEIKSE